MTTAASPLTNRLESSSLTTQTSLAPCMPHSQQPPKLQSAQWQFKDSIHSGLSLFKMMRPIVATQSQVHRPMCLGVQTSQAATNTVQQIIPTSSLISAPLLTRTEFNAQNGVRCPSPLCAFMQSTALQVNAATTPSGSWRSLLTHPLQPSSLTIWNLQVSYFQPFINHSILVEYL